MTDLTEKFSRRKYLADLFAFNVKKAKQSWSLYLFTAPYMILFIVFTGLPVLAALALGFTYFNMIQTPSFIGWANYLRMFLSDDIFLIALKNTLLVSAITGPISYLMCLMFAWMINELQPKVRALLTLVFYGPSLVSLGTMWKMAFSSDQYGMVNGILMNWGLLDQPVRWLEDASTVLAVAIGIMLWSSLSTSFLTFIASLQNVDRALYEAAAVDGVTNRWQELWYITLPYIKPHMMFAAIMSISQSFGMTNLPMSQLVGYASVDYAAHTINQHIYDMTAVRYDMGYAAALTTFLFLLMVISSMLFQKFLSRVGE